MKKSLTLQQSPTLRAQLFFVRFHEGSRSFSWHHNASVKAVLMAQTAAVGPSPKAVLPALALLIQGGPNSFTWKMSGFTEYRCYRYSYSWSSPGLLQWQKCCHLTAVSVSASQDGFKASLAGTSRGLRGAWEKEVCSRSLGEASECHLETQRSEGNGIEVLLFLTTGIFKVHQHHGLFRISSYACSRWCYYWREDQRLIDSYFLVIYFF